MQSLGASSLLPSESPMRGEHGFQLFFEYMLLPCVAVTKSKAETANACASESLNLRVCCHKEEKNLN